MLFTPELSPTRKSDFQDSRSFKLFSMHDSVLAVTIRLTNIIHFMCGSILKEKYKLKLTAKYTVVLQNGLISMTVESNTM